ncbi:MAG: radical SAM protein, partial [Solobacterium sp.]|nr:radical SAM protein [Solobacterium sp.]
MIRRAYIEITNRCNLSCSFCSFHKRPFRDMDVQEFSHVLDEVKPITDYIYLHVQGEPLLHPQFETLMTIADEKQMQVQLVTNGTLLNQYPDLFEHHSLRRLSVSMQSVSYQRSENIEDYLDVLERLM